jgi:hypothetical protein
MREASGRALQGARFRGTLTTRDARANDNEVQNPVDGLATSGGSFRPVASHRAVFA